ncbi:bestrophin family protein [Aureimonas psammosilenae]|uniref:bestrophin family protein n=1 Tax=Aureimonas psammosilenae TaxID=2495496 RepID=UPI0012611EE5|nr:bestrophin family ion channel [Aureimonas psammosilenae]
MVLPESAKLGRMLHYIGWPLFFLLMWDIAVTVAYVLIPHKDGLIPSIPMTLLGSALALFLGFRNNNAYNRWWEARTLWGSMVNASRSFSRMALHLIDENHDSTPLRRALVRRQIAYVHALRCHLRKQECWDEIAPYLPEGEVDELKSMTNVPNAILNGTAKLIASASREGWIDSIRRTQMEAVMMDISNAQGGMERIKNTPLPREYDFYPTLFSRIFCVILPLGLVDSLLYMTPLASSVVGFMFLAMDRIGEDLQNPFDNRAHDVPLAALTRTIEIDLEQAIGEEDVAQPLKPVDNVLW